MITRVVDDVRDLGRFETGWDELAVANSRPYCSPAWMTAWWRHAKPRGAVLRTVLVLDRGELLGIAPLFAQRSRTAIMRYRILGAQCSSHVDLLARPGTERDVADAIAACLGRVRPSVDSLVFEGVRESSPWPGLLAASWPSERVSVSTDVHLLAPTLRLSGSDYTHWYASKSRNFRQSMRRKQRHLQDMGATFHVVDDSDDLEERLDEFVSLHEARWRSRGGSRVLRPGIREMLLEVGQRLLPLDRFKLWRIEIDDRCISSHLFLTAGSETAYWLGGFDEGWSRYHPGLLTILAAIEHAFLSDLELVDLGTGAQDYKTRFSDQMDGIHWINVVPRRLAVPLARFELLPMRARLAAAQGLPPRMKHLLRGIVRHFPHRGALRR
jgi:CelD/BcsL family acetyltransferase involved in cellulose biosynthesis